MFDRPALIYRCEDSLDGLLCCVFESYVRREEPMDIQFQGDWAGSLYPVREIETDPQKAARVARSLFKISERVFDLVRDGMYSAMPHRGMVVYQFIRLAYRVGDKAILLLTDGTVDTLHHWVQLLRHEAHQFCGFVRFTDTGEALVAKIEPKGQVLPLIAGHFAGRYPGEQFLIFDSTHQMALIHRPGRTAILPVEALEIPPATAEEAQYRQLWRAYHKAISIRERENPRAQRGHLPLRYRGQMTEFQPEEPAFSPPSPKALP